MPQPESAGVLLDSQPVSAPAADSGCHGATTRYRTMPVRKRLLGGVGWATAGSCLGQGASLVASLVLARVLGRRVFGEYILIQSTVVALASFACLGLGVAATKYVSLYRRTDPARAGRILGLANMVAFLSGLIFSIGLAGLAPSLVPAGAGRAAVVDGLRWSAPYVFWMALNASQVGTLAGLERFRAAALIHTSNGFATLLATWLLTRGFGLKGAVVAQAAGAFFLWLQYHLAITAEIGRQGIAVSYRTAWSERSALALVSAPAAISGVIGSAAIWWSNANLVKAGSYGELAIFGAANNLRLATLFFPLIVYRVAAPVLNSLATDADSGRYRRTFWGVTALGGGAAASLAVILCLFGQRLLHLFGKDFVSPAGLIAVLLGSVCLEALSGGLYHAIFTSGSLWLHFAISTLWAAILVTAGRIAVVHAGAVGLALAYLLAWSCSCVCYGVVAIRRLEGGARRRGAATL